MCAMKEVIVLHGMKKARYTAEAAVPSKQHREGYEKSCAKREVALDESGRESDQSRATSLNS